MGKLADQVKFLIEIDKVNKIFKKLLYFLISFIPHYYFLFNRSYLSFSIMPLIILTAFAVNI